MHFIFQESQFLQEKGVIDVPMYKQVCALSRDFLLEYNGMEQTQLEIIESADMMRFLENGSKLKWYTFKKIIFQ